MQWFYINMSLNEQSEYNSSMSRIKLNLIDQNVVWGLVDVGPSIIFSSIGQA